MERKEFIKDEIKEEPENPFNYYLLALELKKEGDLSGSLDLFNQLIERFPSYIPTYYSFADFLLEIEDDIKAKQIIELGIIRAEGVGQTKALHELKQMWELNF
ncbi:tetratricopeptide repeat protein [Aquirufa salirivi]|uniref:Tetratricopeptide repeat protein n=1 Tax=Aquirufa salirivi TaxID=3104729 RepID=A0ABW8RSR8_9BACT